MRLPVKQESENLKIDKFCYKIAQATKIFTIVGVVIIFGVWLVAVFNCR